jgi:FkbM family methyltransferase
MANLIKKYGYYLWSVVELLSGFENPLLISQIFLTPSAVVNRKIHLKGENVAFVVRSAMDVWSVKEAYLDRFYERFGAAIEDDWVIIDIGGGIGEFTLRAAKGYPGNKVFVFEPFRESYNLLKTNLEINQISNVETYELAVWSDQGYLMLDASAGEPSQFISVEPRPGGQISTDQPIVRAITLVDAFNQTGIDHCDLLKIDCEGAEYPILFSTPVDILKKIDRIILEYHDHGSHTHTDLEKYLSERGYRVRVTPNSVHTYLGYLYAQRE